MEHSWHDNHKAATGTTLAKHWVFTAWEEPTLSELPENVSYIGYGKETCPTTLKTHWQGYVEFTKKMRVNPIRKFLAGHGVNNVWLALRLGKASEADAYCRKENDHKSFGTLSSETSHQGERTDIQCLIADIKGGNMPSFRSGCLNGTIKTYQHIKITEKILTHFEPQRDFKTRVIVHWGPSGFGKSRYVYHEFPNKDDVYCAGGDWPRWWPNYDAHPVVWIDEFRGCRIKFSDLLPMLDRFPYRVEFKGGSRQLLAKTIVITSPSHPRNWYQNQPEQLEQLLRRIDTIRYFYRQIDELDPVSRIAFTETSGKDPPLTAPLELKAVPLSCNRPSVSLRPSASITTSVPEVDPEVEGNITTPSYTSGVVKRPSTKDISDADFAKFMASIEFD